jgi:threonine dehydratase
MLEMKQIEAANEVVSKFLAPTPLVKNEWLSQRYGCEVFLKLENMQPIGSFKIRGALCKIAALTESEREAGVVAASAGNHAQGVAWAARKFGVDATIVMPQNAPLTKVQNTKGFGANVVLHGDNFEGAFAHAEAITASTGKLLVHAYDDQLIMAGQGTLCIELRAQIADLDMIITPIGGGGLLGGVAVATKSLWPEAQVVGCQASGARGMVESLRTGQIVAHAEAETFADGIKVRKVSPRIFGLLQRTVDRTLHCDDEEIAAAVLMMLEKAKTLAEGAGALPLAALDSLYRSAPESVSGKRIVLVVCGGNIDVNLLARIIDRGLIRAGRRLRLNVFISDKPGTLNQLTHLIASSGGSILQVIHDRNAPSVGLLETGVELTIETKGQDHSKELVQIIGQHFARLELLH